MEFINNWYETEIENARKSKFLTTHPDKTHIMKPYLILKMFSSVSTRKDLTQDHINDYVNSLENIDELINFLLGNDEIYLTLDEMKFALKETVVRFKDRIGEIIPEYKKRLIRAKKIKSSQYKLILLESYGFYNMNQGNVTDIVMKEKNKYEDFILNFDKQDYRKIAEEFGIIIPHFILHMYHKKYILNEFMKIHEKIINREKTKIPEFSVINSREISDFIHILTVKEILFFTNIGIMFQNREHYIANVLEFITREKFFIPIRPIKERSSNEETTLLTEIIEEDGNFICFGTIFKYVTYEASELIASFQNKTARKPNDISDKFKDEEIFELKCLISEYALINLEFNDLILVCDEILNSNMKIQEEFKNIVSIYLSLVPEEKEKLDTLFNEIIKAGMYMRRWKGEGFPYPLSEKSTVLSIEPEIRTLPQIALCAELIEKMDSKTINLYKSLPSVNFKDILNATTDNSLSLSKLLESVSAGKYCIRMASSVAIKSSYYYKLILCKTSFQGFNPKDIDFIY